MDIQDDFPTHALNTKPELCVQLTRCVFLFSKRDSMVKYVCMRRLRVSMI